MEAGLDFNIWDARSTAHSRLAMVKHDWKLAFVFTVLSTELPNTELELKMSNVNIAIEEMDLKILICIFPFAT